jgi:2-polyprenyl-6-methoxyphenol hydroxylase-like FAD-dependent oxidoreductase
MQSLNVAVVGAGVTGLACAILLARDGHRVVVHERFETSRPLGSGLMLQPTGLAALERLGLREAIEALGARIDGLYGTSANGATIFDLAYADLDPRFHAVGIHRAALHGVLWNAFKTCGAALETGQSIAAIETLSDGKVTLRDDRGHLGPAFDLVLDASGARSPLRAAVTSAQAKPFSYGAVWASVPDIGISPGQLSQRYVAAKVMIGYLPIGRSTPHGVKLAALFWSLRTTDYGQWRASFTAWRERVVELWPELAPTIATLTQPDDLTPASYVQFTAKKPFKGPVALVGDSAHATSPQLGQGANNGLLDAIALRDALIATSDVSAALTLYARQRRDHVRFYQIASALMTPFFQSDSRSLARVRDIAFDRMKIVPYLHREMLRTLAGLKTGLFSSSAPEIITAGGRRYGLPLTIRPAE